LHPAALEAEAKAPVLQEIACQEHQIQVVVEAVDLEED
jgi:hypothetical protein